MIEIQSTYPQWHEVQRPDELTQFADTYFLHFESYSQALEENIEKHATRFYNPLYAPFAARMLLVAAEFGFPALNKHTERHNGHNWYHRDFMHPVHLLALGRYLARAAVMQFDTKSAVLDTWDQEQYQPDMRVYNNLLSAWVTPGRAFPGADELGDEPRLYHADRPRYGLPVFIPDIPFLRSLATIPLTGDEADRISADEFESAVLPFVRNVFSSHHPDSLAALLLNEL